MFSKLILNDTRVQPVLSEAIIGTTQQGEVMLLKSEPDIIELGIIEDCDLSDYTEGLGTGKIFKCVIRWHGYQSNHPLDPPEWDLDIYVEDIEEIFLVDKRRNLLSIIPNE